ncbi:MAG: hypothetical protein G8D28_02180 [gamma proteobacterium symbiont of Phacoides pectinatus]
MAGDPVALGSEAFERGEWGRALAYWGPLAEAGDARAQFYLSVLYAQGLGVEADTGEALRWLRAAAEGGMRTAQYFLGEHYRVGDWVEQDTGQVVYWWRLAARSGMAKAQYKLGLLYALGLGVPADREQAVYWHRAAAANGDEDARRALRLLDEPLRPLPARVERAGEGLDLRLSGRELQVLVEGGGAAPAGGGSAAGGEHQDARSGVAVAQPLSVATDRMAGDTPVEEGIEWVRSQPPGHYTIQLLAGDERGRVAEMASRLDLDGPVVLFPYQVEGAPMFGLLHGSFADIR